jgi:hypothetical protein
MDKTIRKYTSFDEMKADEYRYWQSRPVYERTDANLPKNSTPRRARHRMYPSFKELLSALNDHHVKYLFFGAYAVSIHAQPRATKDIDILVKPDAGNARAVYAVLTEFGAPLEGMTL